MSSAVVPGVYRLSYADWLASPDDGLRREIIEGELFVTPPPTIAHQRVSREIGFRLVAFLRERDRGELFYAPVGLRLANEDVLEPDLVVVLRGGRAVIDEAAIIGPADVVIEILSPGTAKRDLIVKRRIYEAHGIREYWIVDPKAAAIDVLVHDGAALVRHALYSLADVLSSPALPGLQLPLDDVFAAAR